MAERNGFFNALESGGVYDRVYDASDFASYFSQFIGDGVYVTPTDQLKVIAKDGLTVTVKAGKAYIDGYYYELTEDMDITLNPNSTSYSIVDLICCTLNLSTREIKVNKKEAVSNITPVNDGTVHELVLASIDVGVGVATITNANITDRRPDKTYCGFVEGVVQQIDESNLFLQFTSMFNNWFNSIKGQLGTDVAGSLQNQITDLKNSLPTIRSGTDAPDNSLGKDGDIYIRIVS